MAIYSLTDDLLQEFKHERDMIDRQLEMLNPLGVMLRKPAVERVLSSTLLVFFELVCYILCLGGIAFMILMSRIPPFNVLTEVLYNAQYRADLGMANITSLNIAVYCMAGLSVLLFFIIARMAHGTRIKNSVLNAAGRDVKVLLDQHMKRKAAINAIEQRHMDMPAFQAKVNDMPNPGYDGNAIS